MVPINAQPTLAGYGETAGQRLGVGSRVYGDDRDHWRDVWSVRAHEAAGHRRAGTRHRAQDDLAVHWNVGGTDRGRNGGSAGDLNHDERSLRHGLHCPWYIPLRLRLTGH